MGPQLESEGVTVELWLEPRPRRLVLSPWYVASFLDRPGQTAGEPVPP
jgi:hypothetical protein